MTSGSMAVHIARNGNNGGYRNRGFKSRFIEFIFKQPLGPNYLSPGGITFNQSAVFIFLSEFQIFFMFYSSVYTFLFEIFFSAITCS